MDNHADSDDRMNRIDGSMTVSRPRSVSFNDTGPVSGQDELDRSTSGYSSTSTNITTPTSSSGSGGLKRSVSFSRLNIRHYERVLGDNPSCSSGPSISIGWKYKDSPSLDIDAYELRRRRKLLIGNGSGPRMMFSRMNRSLSLPNLPSSGVVEVESQSGNGPDEDDQESGHASTNTMYQSFRAATERCKVLSREEREEILLALGYSRGDLADAIRENIKIKNQRRKTVNNLNVMKAEEIIESLTRGVKKGVCLGESGVGLYDEWVRH